MTVFLMGDILLDKIKESDEMKMSLSASWLKKPVAIALVALMCISIIISIGAVGGANGGSLSGEVRIGVLLPLEDPSGEASKAAIDMAVTEVNALLGEAGATWNLEVLVKDTTWDPAIALDKLKELNGEGVKFVIGMSSKQVLEIKDYADAKEILVVSQFSTGFWGPFAELLEDDFIFRFCLPDSIQCRAIARLMYNDGKRYVVPVWIGNEFGDGIVITVEERFKELGGTFLEGIRYAPEEVDFSDEALALRNAVTRAVAMYGARRVGVLYIGWSSEVTAFFTQAKKYLILWMVKWYGSEYTALSGALLDPAVADFCVATRFTNPVFSLTKSDKFDRVHDALVAQLGREPDSFAYVAYDIVWALAYSLSIVNRYDSVAVREVLPEVTESLFGASGWIVLDENGDRARGDYDLWRIVEVAPDVYDWKLVGTWLYDTDSITWL